MKDEEIIEALKLVKEKYGVVFTKTIEQLFRNETRHFKSGNFAVTFAPGMEAFADTSPYGWTSAKPFWESNKNYAPTGIFKQIENNSALAKSIGEKRFIIFPSIEASMMTTAFIIFSRGGAGGTWFSKEKTGIEKYNAELKKIIPRFANTL